MSVKLRGDVMKGVQSFCYRRVENVGQHTRGGGGEAGKGAEKGGACGDYRGVGNVWGFSV